MLPEARLKRIMEIVGQKQTVTTAELSQILEVSDATIRRDIIELDKRGLVDKVFGGAALPVRSRRISVDEDLAGRKGLRKEEKNAIGKFAASLISKGDFVYLDTGSTMQCMATYIQEQNATYVTNSVDIAETLARKNIKVRLTGGVFKYTTQALVGSHAWLGVKNHNFVKGFFGANGIDLEKGFTTPESEEAFLKQQCAAACRQTYILGDYTKFDLISNISFADFTSAVIITAGDIPEKYRHLDNVIEVMDAL